MIEQTQKISPAPGLMVIGAHPDDCESVGGLALAMMEQGWRVCFLSVTNGSAGHHQMQGAALVKRRAEEARRVSEQTGIAYVILDIEDGKLGTSLPEREALMRAIRDFSPEVIITHRPNDYHADHRATALLVQDCSYLLAVPNICPLSPPMARMPAIFYKADRFKKPAPFVPDLVFDVSRYEQRKLQMYHQHTSQMYEWLPWVEGVDLSTIPEDEAGRLAWLAAGRFGQDGRRYAQDWREQLVAKYGTAGQQVISAEALEICEYGRQLSEEELRSCFPL